MTGRMRSWCAVVGVIAFLVGACGGSSDADWCRPAGEGLVELVGVVGTFATIAEEAAAAGLTSEEEFSAFMTDQITPAVGQLDSAEQKMREAAEQADDDLAVELGDLADSLRAASDELITDPAAALGSSELTTLLPSISNQLQEQCGETLADLAEEPDASE